MRNAPDARGWFRMAALFGTMVWLGIAAGSWSGWPQLGVIEPLFLLAPWIAVPLATSLIPPVEGCDSPTRQRPTLNWVMFAAAALPSTSFFFSVGILAASFGAAWLLVFSWFWLLGVCGFWRYLTQWEWRFCFAVV